jgi:ribosomal protein S18 acetylase RimI-like enzyme
MLAAVMAGGSSLMRIDLFDASRRLGSMMLSIGTSDGVIQITDIRVEPDVRRIGHGSAMFHEGLRRARELLAASARVGSDLSSGASSASSPVPLRRVVILLGQKSQLLARGFVLRHGFHHIKTIPGLGQGEDVMVYVKGLN